MDTLRYYLALLLLLGAPPAIVFWLLVHPFIALWRRLGPTVSYGVLWGACLLGMLALYGEADGLLAIEFGPHPLTVGLGATCLVVAAYLRWELARQIATYQLLGLPELD